MEKPKLTMARVLIVEDEPLIALEMETSLSEAGHEIAGSAASIEKALAILDDHSCDVVILDSNLQGERPEPIATALRRSGTPFIVVSGYGRTSLPECIRDAPFVPKPFESEALVRAVKRVLR
jgi:DNA-binding NtrC family response regulator